jgi:hypothetical protein
MQQVRCRRPKLVLESVWCQAEAQTPDAWGWGLRAVCYQGVALSQGGCDERSGLQWWCC